MRPDLPRLAGCIALALSLSACGTLDRQLYVASDTSLGVNGAVNTAQTAGKLVVGYDRKFVAYVPKMAAGGDVMSAYNCTHVEVQGLRITRFSERLATGAAADNVVSQSTAQKQDSPCRKPAAMATGANHENP